jgi:Ca2+:H+ antiporter
MKYKLPVSLWSIIASIVPLLIYFLKPGELHVFYASVLTVALVAAVIAAVHHAEVVAYRTGEPYGTLVLAVAVTVIEVSLIVSLMLSGGKETATLARDTVFAAVMIILTGLIGLCLLIGGFRYREQIFGRHGVSAALVTLTAITVLTLILPNFTTSIAGPFYNKSQLIFVAIISLVLYGTFVKVQTVSHRDYFLPPETKGNAEVYVQPPTNTAAILSVVLLLVCLAAVVLIAKSLSPSIERGIEDVGAPKSLVGIIIALVILLPESFAALRAARRNLLQTSLNLALGSALASIGLTIPAVAIVSVVTSFPVTLGIDTKSMVLLILALFTIMLSFGTGRTTMLQGVVLLIIFAVYIFTTVVP